MPPTTPTAAPRTTPLRSLLRAGRAFGTRLADQLLPPQCIACGAPIDADGALCATCWNALDLIEPPVCDRLGVPFVVDPGSGFTRASQSDMLCADAIANPPVYNRARALARYTGPARDLVHALKYRDRLEVAPSLARHMRRAGGDILEQAELVVPVPLYVTRLWWRRSNQSALLARALARQTGLPVALDLLRRIKATRSQVGLNSSQRRRNVAGAFALNRAAADDIHSRHVLLVDDVITTGATANACAAVLLKAGAAQVDVLAFARVVDGYFAHI